MISLRKDFFISPTFLAPTPDNQDSSAYLSSASFIFLMPVFRDYGASEQPAINLLPLLGTAIVFGEPLFSHVRPPPVESPSSASDATVAIKNFSSSARLSLEAMSVEDEVAAVVAGTVSMVRKQEIARRFTL